MSETIALTGITATPDGWRLVGEGGQVVGPIYKRAYNARRRLRELTGERQRTDYSKPDLALSKGARPCLCCSSLFISLGIGNRLCPDCSSSVSRMDPRMI